MNSQVAFSHISHSTALPALIDRASRALAGARSSAEILEARDMANAVYTAAARRVGRNAPAIADKIMGRIFPATIAEAEIEGASTMLRVGVIAAVKGVLKHGERDGDTIDFASLDPSFGRIIKELKSKTYFVESLDEYVPIGRLIDYLSLLDDARNFMRRKGEECLAEAKVLDELYEAIAESQSS